MPLPYASSVTGQAREREIRANLRSVGATAVGFMVDDDTDQIIAQFRLHGREITIPVRVGAYADAWLRENKRGPRSRITDSQHREKARKQAELAAWAILADWIKAQAAMMAAGFVDTDEAFLPHIHLPNGRRVVDAMTAKDSPLRLPPPADGT
jgi:oligoribonuclease (3'-5' exoribonuclease)